MRTADGPDAAGAPARTAWPLLWAVPCHVYGCAPLFWSLDRRERERERQAAQRTEPAPAPPITDLWGSSGVWGYTRRIPPPTPDSEIRPEYRDSGRLRPEFAPAPAPQ